jgi:ZIP family zinc transporter
MTNSGQLITAMLLASGVVAAAIAAGAATTVWPPSDRFRSFLQHFAAGSVFSALALEVLPDIVRRGRPFAVAGGFTIGVLVMLAIRQFADEGPVQDEHSVSRQGQKANTAPTVSSSLILISGFDVLIDGLLLGLSFSLGERAGLLLMVGLGAETISLSTVVATELGKRGLSRASVIARTAAVAFMMLVGTLGGLLFLSNLSVVPAEAILAFAAAALLFLVTEELLVEAHQIEESPLSTAMFFIGFLLILILRLIQ